MQLHLLLTNMWDDLLAVLGTQNHVWG